LISYHDIVVTGGFWHELQARNQAVTVPAVRRRFLKTGRFAALDFSTLWEEGKKPHIFWDSDIAKWMEAAAYILQKERDPALERAVEEAISLIEKNQDRNGYFNSYFMRVEPEKRWQNRDAHELYCAGHLMEAAVAYYEATGRDRFLHCMIKYAAYIEKVFMIERSAAFQTPGHEEIELALVKLYRCTGEARWLRLSQFFINQRGANGKDAPVYSANQSYSQSHLPAREQFTAEGHAVRAMYLYCAMADLALECGDEGLLNACRALFVNITEKRMYITGGLGSSHHGEAFTFDYDLPNETAYSETCAAIGLALFCRRMSALEPDSRYADAAERAIYNCVLAGVSEKGDAFFYENPLEIHPEIRGRGERFPITRRQKVFGCSCCPPNLTRFIASYADFLFTRHDDILYVHHYTSARTEHIEIITEYPREGEISLRVRGMAGGRLALRIPGWCENFHCGMPGTLDRGYYYIDIPDDDFALTLTLDMPVRLTYADARVYGNTGRAAVTRGPVVYCMESIDNGDNLRALSIAPGAQFTGGFDLLECNGHRVEEQGALYRFDSPKRVSQKLRFIPYFRYANRGESEMAVWVRAEGV